MHRLHFTTLWFASPQIIGHTISRQRMSRNVWCKCWNCCWLHVHMVHFLIFCFQAVLNMLLYVTPVIFRARFLKGKYLHNGCSVFALKKGWGCPPDTPSDQLVMGGTFSSHWQLAAELDCLLWGLRGVDECLSLPALPLRMGLLAALLMWSAVRVWGQRDGNSLTEKKTEFWRWQRSSVSWETRQREKRWTGLSLDTNSKHMLNSFWSFGSMIIFQYLIKRFFYMCVS